jgi:hypothetical protein
MISNMLRQISQETGIATATVNEFISVTAMSIAQNREASTSRREVMLETGFSREMVDQLVEHCIEIGLLAAVETASGYVRFIVEEFFNRLSQTDILSD